MVIQGCLLKLFVEAPVYIPKRFIEICSCYLKIFKSMIHTLNLLESVNKGCESTFHLKLAILLCLPIGFFDILLSLP